MKYQRNANRIARTGLVLTMSLATWTVHAQVEAANSAKPTPTSDIAKQCESMKAQKLKLTDELKTEDAQLAQELAQTNSVPKDKRAELMAAIMARMAEQRVSKNARQESMDAQVVEHISLHATLGSASVAECVLLNDKGKTDAEPVAEKAGKTAPSENVKAAKETDTAEAKGDMDEKMMENCEAMKAEKLTMMQDMKAQDAELNKQLAAMNSAPADKKVGLMADILTEMVKQRISMDARHEKLKEDMMGHMMQHMKASDDSMSKCPMMKATKTVAKASKQTRVNAPPQAN